jgi:beta-glucosidase/6-phospho-beta-glucosidase/beta-galactosidase
MKQQAPQLQSFIMAGFECTAARVSPHERLDMLSITGHREMALADYRLIKAQGITTVREGLSWAHIDKGRGHYDFSAYETLLTSGQTEAIQQVWDLNHFDYPDYLDPFSPDFITAFATYSVAAVKYLRRFISTELIIAPINEISFFAWIAADQGKWAPFKKGSEWGFRFKTQLVKATIQAMAAIRAMDSSIRFIHIDPFMRRVAKTPSIPKARKHVNHFNEVIRFEAWDMLSGKTYPELGGDPKYLDLVGVNYYLHNQEWVISHPKQNRISHQMMAWHDPARVSLAKMLQEVHRRYQKPIVVSETGSFGSHRGNWWRRTVKEVKEALAMSLPLRGVCIYPTLDRPATTNFLLPQSGIYDFDYQTQSLARIPHEPSLRPIRQFLSSH